MTLSKSDILNQLKYISDVARESTEEREVVVLRNGINEILRKVNDEFYDNLTEDKEVIEE